VGCSGWSYTSWQGPFYIQNLTNSGWLNYYSHVFDYVEIDSSLYRIPNVFMVNNWNTKTPSTVASSLVLYKLGLGVRLIRGFAYGLINALHNQRLLVSFVDKPSVRTDVPHLIHVSRASSSPAMHTKRESKTEFL